MQYNFITLWNSKMMNDHQFEADLSIGLVASVPPNENKRKKKKKK